MRRLVRRPVRGSKRINDLGTLAELRVKTVKYFRSIERVQDEVEAIREKPEEK